MCTVLYQQFCPIADRACLLTIMYWSAHVGTQENGWHDVMTIAKMVALSRSGVLRLTSEYNNYVSWQKHVACVSALC